ncbi:amidohydrolase 3 [Aspergillus campestris IBT 28561]|uniref:Amidohydrolase 3 n=1 Tax=Aspergillus campestris (strain IBT 28561) TaxID=1392248 RepID=A0A2I1CVI2_ASPC2|nr:amidohydrolase 3 [Aspergillus campestris IBT 28561]PKY01625.1 amidohydrolase 3 [Aspergillus campestris IBT 28561]
MKILFRNGTIVPGSAVTDSLCTCMIIEDDRIVYVGNDEPISLEGYKVVDLEGKKILPGFIDGHMHLLLFGASLSKIDLSACTSLASIRSTIQSAAAARPNAPRLFCRGWMHSMTDGAALANMLDDLDPRPIFIDSKDLHSAWCNTPALRELGVLDSTTSPPDPAGGVIHRDPLTGIATGLLSETAAVNIVWPHVAKVASPDEKLAFIRDAVSAYNAAGYTGMIEMATDENLWETMRLLRAREPVPIRLAAHWIIAPKDSEEEVLAQVDRAIALHKEFNRETSPDFRIAGIKLICDGVVDACTAALVEPYATTDTTGDMLWDPAILRKVVHRADGAGLQCALHAIGDAAVQMALDALESCSAVNGAGSRDRRHRIEHLELTRPGDAARLAKLGITASVQPVHADPAILRAWPKLLGEERCRRAFAYREFVDEGANLAIGTDSPTAPHWPLRNVYTAVTRRSAREPDSHEVVNKGFALGLMQAVGAATAGSAYSCFAEAVVGRLGVGMRADFVVLDMEWGEGGYLMLLWRRRGLVGDVFIGGRSVEVGVYYQ